MLVEFTQKYQIKDLEILSGIKAHTIRMWEQRYNIFVPERSDTNIRYYSEEDLKKILNIVSLLKKGYKIGDFKDVPNQEIIDLVKKSTHRIPELENFLTAMLSYDFEYFNKIFDEAIYSIGFEKTLELILYPLLDKLGFLWLTNSISPAHEHFVSNIIRQKFLSQIDQLDETDENSKTFILFLPYYEQHETSLLFSYYLVRKFKHKAIYLGQNVPTEDIINAGITLNPDFIISFFITQMPEEEIETLLRTISGSLPKTILLAGGSQVNKGMEKLNKNIKIITSPMDLKNQIIDPY